MSSLTTTLRHCNISHAQQGADMNNLNLMAAEQLSSRLRVSAAAEGGPFHAAHPDY